MIIDLHPEFGLELVLGIPHAYWLHKQGKLEGVRTVKGMKPFYYFYDNVQEVYDHRTIDNSAAGLDELPNNWIHHCPRIKSSNGVLDYSKWVVPPYKEIYTTSEFNFDKQVIVVSNRYNIEHGNPPIGYFDIPVLYEIFNYLTENNYIVVYKRPKNIEFPLDQNEASAIMNGYSDIVADVEGVGLITDYDLTGHYEDVILLDDIIKEYGGNNCDVNTYNEIQLKLFSNVEGFLTMGGGSSLLCSHFGKPNISYFTTEAECTRDNYFSDECYYRKLSEHEFYPILDWEENIKKRGNRDYSELIKKIKEVF